jgi:D-alanyl-D-alanine carboxypeptidase (penicillin-binding protein 5/6)
MRSLGSLVIFFLISLFFPLSAWGKAPEITAEAAVLMDAASGKVFYAKNPFQQRSPASLTKIMTALLAIEYGRLDEVVTISPRAAAVSEGSIIGLSPGEKITLRNLLKAALIKSANDSTVAIAEHVAGSEENFLALMNAKAVLLGALRTRFANTNGYTHPNHYSTAYDLALITRYALQNPVFREFVRTREDVVEWVGKPRREAVYNTNRLLHGGYPGLDGVKTGSTASAGNCLVATARQGDRRLISVVLHSQNRYLDTVKLLNYGFEQIEAVPLCQRGETAAVCSVQEGKHPQVAAVAGDDLRVDVLREDLPKLRRLIVLDAPLKAPVKQGQQLGRMVFYLGEEELGAAALFAAHDVQRQNWLLRMKGRLEMNKKKGRSP